MKKSFLIAIIAVIAVLIAVIAFMGGMIAGMQSGGGSTTTTTPAHVHTEVIDPESPAGCINGGFTEGKHCSECGEVLVEQQPTDALGHSFEEVDAVAPTCTTVGYTAGVKCSVCGEYEVEPEEIPVVAHTYDDQYDAECNVCGFTRDAACAHTETEVIPGKAATCTATGLTDGAKCKKCGETVTAQTVIAKKSHTEVTDAKVNATCTETGLTEGKHCSVCGTVTVAQETIPATGHSYTSVVTPPTATEGGYTTYTCSCGHSYVGDETPATGSGSGSDSGSDFGSDSEETESFEYSVNEDGTTCSISKGTITDTVVVIPAEIDGYKVTSIANNAFQGATEITSVTIPNGVTSIGSMAFAGCTALETVNIPSSVTSIEGLAFTGCSSLKDVDIPNSVTSIGGGAFTGCTSLTNIKIPNGITKIETGTFTGCTSLISITIPASVTEIGSLAFSGCSSLLMIRYEGTKDEWNAISFKMLWNTGSGTYTIICKNGIITKS